LPSCENGDFVYGKTALDYSRGNEKLKDTGALRRLEELSR